MDKIFNLKEINIKSYRGIKNLEMKDTTDINIILGNNNCGKTSVLEAIHLLKTPDVYNVVDTSLFHMGQTIYARQDSSDSFKNAFPIDKNEIEINAKTSIGPINYYINYHVEPIKFNKDIFMPHSKEQLINSAFVSKYIDILKLDGRDTYNYYGKYRLNSTEHQYSFLPLDLQFRKVKKPANLNKIIYMAPFAHFNINPSDISIIVRDRVYSKLFIEVLKIFDESIEDVKIILNGIGNPEIFIQKINENPQPLYLYGDGIKKVCSIASYLAKANKGILLIDEIETSLHYSYFDDIFAFLIKVAKQLNVQVFITTHSKETIEKFLNIGEDLQYDNLLSIYTIRNTKEKTYCRLLKESDARNYIFTSKMEVRD